MLKGNGIGLRPVRRSDLQHFLKWFNDPEVLQYLSLYLPMTEMGEEKYIEELGTTRAYTDTRFVIEAVEGDATRPIGTVSLHGVHSKNHNATLGIAIGDRDCLDKGHGTEATRLIVEYGFQQLNLHRISSGAFSFDERGMELHNRVGFSEEGRSREAVFKNGTYHDQVMFGILREEWSTLGTTGD